MMNEFVRPHIRPRRNRKSAGVRAMVAEHKVTTDDLIAPLFLVEKKGERQAIKTMPGQFRLGPDQLLKEVKELHQLGIKSVCLFPALDDRKKDRKASEAMNTHGFYPQAIKMIKNELPEMVVMTDIALDPYSSDGHDGLVDPKTGTVLNDETLDILAEMAVIQANAGADILGPSDMMDGRVGVIRQALDEEGFFDTSIMSYTAKYASGFYGPFRDALESAPKKGDKKTYQMDYANVREALLEAELDAEEGADILMVKPGLPYLDILAALREESLLPLAAYNVSGEYAMIKAAAAQGMVDGTQCMIESLTAFKRAGADIILTYFAREFAEWSRTSR
jgi:porphobilinogen synthase